MTSQETASLARALLEEGWTAAFECPQFTPAFVDALIGDQRVTAHHCTCGDPKWLHDVARELQRVETLEAALREIAAHDGERGEFTDEDVWDRKPSPQEIAHAALAGEETPNGNQ